MDNWITVSAIPDKGHGPESGPQLLGLSLKFSAQVGLLLPTVGGGELRPCCTPCIRGLPRCWTDFGVNIKQSNFPTQLLEDFTHQPPCRNSSNRRRGIGYGTIFSFHDGVQGKPQESNKSSPIAGQTSVAEQCFSPVRSALFFGKREPWAEILNAQLLWQRRANIGASQPGT